MREREGLRARIDMMELEGGAAGVVSATDAAPTGLLDQDPLDPASPVGHPLLSAPDAAVGATLVEPEHRGPVPPAFPHDLARSRGRVDRRTPGVGPGDVPPPQPVPDGRDRPIQSHADFAKAGAASGELFELLSIRGSAGRELGHRLMFARGV
jgi:hypothetical protein